MLAAVASSSPTAQQQRIADSLTERVLKEAQVVEDGALDERVKAICQRLQVSQEGPSSHRVFLTAKGHATVLPSGPVLLPRDEAVGCMSDDELAGVIAVEVSRAKLNQ
ncbi:MAG: hypothetical protein ACHQ50_12195 [Fimbriimonadales bacterium]